MFIRVLSAFFLSLGFWVLPASAENIVFCNPVAPTPSDVFGKHPSKNCYMQPSELSPSDKALTDFDFIYVFDVLEKNQESAITLRMSKYETLS